MRMRGLQAGRVYSQVFVQVREGPEFPGARRMAQLAQSFGLNLADAFAGYLEVLSDLFQRMLCHLPGQTSSG